MTGLGSPMVLGLVWAQRAAVCCVVLAATGAFLVGCFWESHGAEASQKRTDAQVFWFLDCKLQSVLDVLEQRQYSALGSPVAERLLGNLRMWYLLL